MVGVGLDASVHSYRVKLKEWHAFNSDIIETTESNDGLGSSSSVKSEVDPAPLPTLRTLPEGGAGVGTLTTGSSLDWSLHSTLPKLPLPTLFDTIKSLAAHDNIEALSQHLDASCWGWQDNILHYAAGQNDPPTLHAILTFLRSRPSGMIHIHHRDGQGRTALEIAVIASLEENVRLLLQAGASVYSRTAQERTPLHVAIKAQASQAVVEMLLDYGADVHAEDANFVTPTALQAQRRESEGDPQGGGLDRSPSDAGASASLADAKVEGSERMGSLEAT
ncbi:hypothetical protein KC343_g7044 [Hortaea werneckii]|nr:hypothetical protein KC317_g3481 [Hortaea werneckii]KAI7617449.1 hypothetical protein KC346_g5472 [Hortaea werneckii]KAI7624256.1 hypothetical protein KC343_g7044 [Hortaea werneckii]KAI7668687.1 hypothetical protein KC319_g6314 [Hortaea werneckii]KAI7703929.1 hypothetical protein KC322_g6883 [Hortaea werneckii]